MHEKIAGSKLVIMPNAGHMNFVDQPEMWQKAVGDSWGNKRSPQMQNGPEPRSGPFFSSLTSS